jgi:transposase
MTQPAPARITVGVDTHAEVHVAVANDSFGRRLDAISVATTPAGYAELLGWARRLGPINAWGIEGTGSFGAGLTRFLHRHGQVVVEVNRPTDRRGADAASPTPWTPRRPPEPPKPVRAPSPRPATGRWR